MKQSNSYTKPLLVLTSLFFMWGFITCMNDILIPYLKKLFELSYFEAMLVQFSFFGAYFAGSLIYFIISVRKGDPILRIGYKNGIIAGLIISAFACLLFYPAAELKIYGFFLAALFVLALGFTLLQIAANPYVAILGKPETASGRLNLSQGFNSLGTTLAPIVGGYLVFHYFAGMGSPLLDSAGKTIELGTGVPASAASVQIPYIIFTAIFLLLALIIRLVPLPNVHSQESGIVKHNVLQQYPGLWFGIFAIFMYVGGEVSIGSVIINYIKESFGTTENEAKTYLAFYWGGAMTGRFLGAISNGKHRSTAKKAFWMIITAAIAIVFILFAVNYETESINISEIWPFIGFVLLNIAGFLVGRTLAGRTLAIFSLIAVILLAMTLWYPGRLALWSLLAIGLFNSIMWSNIFTLAIKDLGKYTSQASSLLVMAILGGAIIPLIQGAVADSMGISNSFFVPMISYVYLAWYGWKGNTYKTINNEGQ